MFKVTTMKKKITARKLKSRGPSAVKAESATDAPMMKAESAAPKKRSLFAFMAGEFEIVGDIESPVFAGNGWEATK